jgi:hypothetical protein
MLKQKNHKFKASLGYIATISIKKEKKPSLLQYFLRNYCMILQTIAKNVEGHLLKALFIIIEN